MRKTYLLALTITTALLSNALFASFPVETANNKNEKTVVVDSKEVNEINAVESAEVEKAISDVDTKVSKKQLKKEMKKSLSNRMDEELLITLLLWFFLGALAAHRWYRGKPTGWNILFILTAGGCGIWALVDLINILTKKF